MNKHTDCPRCGWNSEIYAARTLLSHGPGVLACLGKCPGCDEELAIYAMPEGRGVTLRHFPDERIKEIGAALEDIVTEFALWDKQRGGIWPGAISAVKKAFEVLGWGDFHKMPNRAEMEKGNGD